MKFKIIIFIIFALILIAESNLTCLRYGTYIFTTCENETMSIKCCGGLINVIDAFYGRYNKNTCNSNNTNFTTTNCLLNNTRQSICLFCNQNRECNISADNQFFNGDPCNGINKYFILKFSCEPPRFWHLFTSSCYMPVSNATAIDLFATAAPGPLNTTTLGDYDYIIPVESNWLTWQSWKTCVLKKTRRDMSNSNQIQEVFENISCSLIRELSIHLKISKRVSIKLIYF